MKEWISAALLMAACLFIWNAGYHKGAESVTFTQLCEQSGGRMESSTRCVIPPSNPPPESQTIQA